MMAQTMQGHMPDSAWRKKTENIDDENKNSTDN